LEEINKLKVVNAIMVINVHFKICLPAFILFSFLIIRLQFTKLL